MSPFNWLLYLDVADYLLSRTLEEYCRSAISRAYYGVHGVIKAQLEARGLSFRRRRDSKKAVINWLKSQRDDHALVKLGVELDRLLAERNEADYDTNKVFSYTQAQISIARARNIQTGISRI